MKTFIQTIIWISVLTILSSCNDPGKIKITNHVDGVTLKNVCWGDFIVAEELLPGETSPEIIISYYEMKLPASNKISFTMNTNNQTILLYTNESYNLEEGDSKTWIMDDSTKVYNPN